MERQVRCGLAARREKWFLLLALVLALGLGADASAKGGDLIWARSVWGDSTCIPLDVASDAQGNCYVLGGFSRTVDFDPGPGTANIYSPDESIFVLKLDAAGNFLWVKSWYKISSVRWAGWLPSFAVDADGNVYLGGSFSGTVDFDPGYGTANLTSSDKSAFMLKLNPSGNLLWAKSFGRHISIGVYVNNSLSVDSSGNIYFSGIYDDTADFDPGPGVAVLTPENLTGIFLVKLDASGNFLWAKGLNSDDNMYGGTLLLTTDVEGHLLMAGTFYNTLDVGPGPGTVILSTSNSTSGFLVKFDESGSFLWGKSFDTDNRVVPGWVMPADMSVDADSNVYLAGQFTGTADFDPGPGTVNFTAGPNAAGGAFVVKLNTSGDLSWVKALTVQDTMGGSWASGVAVDAGGDVFVAGASLGKVYLDGSVILDTGEEGRTFAMKLDASGNLVWAESLVNYSTGTIVNWIRIALSSDGNAFFTQTFGGPADFDPGPGTAILTNDSGGAATAIVKFDGSGKKLTFDLTNPGGQVGTVGDWVSLQLQTTGLGDCTPTFDAHGLPSGLSINPFTGLISGTLDVLSPGVHTVTATVSDGQLYDTEQFTWTVVESVGVPQVVGMTRWDAQAAIEAANLIVGTVTEQSSVTVPASVVLSQEPASGTLPPGSAVNLVVSKGPQPVVVPSLLGKTQADAEAMILAAGLTVGTATEQYSAIPAGLVIGQNPAYGTLPSGSAVYLVVSKGPQPVGVPNVVGMTQADARAALLEAHLNVGTVSERYSATVAPGLVVSQEPASGALPPGSGVNLVVATRRLADLDGSGKVDAPDVQLVINAALGHDIGSINADLNDDARVNAFDIQMVINAALGRI